MGQIEGHARQIGGKLLFEAAGLRGGGRGEGESWHVLTCNAVCCSVLQCVAVCCSV